MESSAPKEPSPKRPCTDLWKSFTEILEEAGTSTTGSSDCASEIEIDKYLSEPLLQFHKSNCWAENKERFPALAKVAQRYLNAPPTSVPSERLFYGAGDIYSYLDKRNRLAPERAETLLFIKNNFKYIH